MGTTTSLLIYFYQIALSTVFFTKALSQIFGHSRQVRQPEHRHDLLRTPLPVYRLGHYIIPLGQKRLGKFWNLLLQPPEYPIPEIVVRLDPFDKGRRHLGLRGIRRHALPHLGLQFFHLLTVRLAQTSHDAQRIARAQSQVGRPPQSQEGIPIPQHDLGALGRRPGDLLGRSYRRQEFSPSHDVIPQSRRHVVVHGRESRPPHSGQSVQERLPREVPPRPIGVEGYVVLGGRRHNIVCRRVRQYHLFGGQTDPFQSSLVEFDHDDVGTDRFDHVGDLLVGLLGEMGGTDEGDELTRGGVGQFQHGASLAGRGGGGALVVGAEAEDDAAAAEAVRPPPGRRRDETSVSRRRRRRDGGEPCRRRLRARAAGDERRRHGRRRPERREGEQQFPAPRLNHHR
mmetsp:Transcript_35396/g.105733  ORF Transcript_35396/g.105733 Transcript_35396/m.105733 type:complete len:398 (+) Transcript_35396:26-1219(+)